jgi:hypothetical protein
MRWQAESSAKALRLEEQRWVAEIRTVEEKIWISGKKFGVGATI